jgi:hypothetical protein
VEPADFRIQALCHSRDRARADGVLQEQSGEGPHLSGAHPADERRTRQPVDLWLPTLVVQKDLGLKARRPRLGDAERAQQTQLGRQVSRVGPVAVPLTLWAPLVPCRIVRQFTHGMVHYLQFR